MHWLPRVTTGLLLLGRPFILCGSDNNPSVLLRAMVAGLTLPNRSVACGPMAPCGPPVFLGRGGRTLAMHGLNWLSPAMTLRLARGLMFSSCLLPGVPSNLMVILEANLLGGRLVGMPVCPLFRLKQGLHPFICSVTLLLTGNAEPLCGLTLGNCLTTGRNLSKWLLVGLLLLKQNALSIIECDLLLSVIILRTLLSSVAKLQLISESKRLLSRCIIVNVN